MQNVFDFLKDNNIPFEKFEHRAVFTTKESDGLDIGPLEQNTKNLFLADEQDQHFYLLTIQHQKRANLKHFAAAVDEKRLHFGPADKLLELLGLTPGSVSPLGLINDNEGRVKFFLDADLLEQPNIYVHPNINTATLKLAMADFQKAVKLTGHDIHTYRASAAETT